MGLLLLLISVATSTLLIARASASERRERLLIQRTLPRNSEGATGGRSPLKYGGAACRWWLGLRGCRNTTGAGPQTPACFACPMARRARTARKLISTEPETGAVTAFLICSLALGMGRGRTTSSAQCERIVDLGAGRSLTWASSPPSYLASLSAHPVELRARIDSCRSAHFSLGVIEQRPRGSSVSPGPTCVDRPRGIAAWDAPLALRR